MSSGPAAEDLPVGKKSKKRITRKYALCYVQTDRMSLHLKRKHGDLSEQERKDVRQKMIESAPITKKMEPPQLKKCPYCGALVQRIDCHVARKHKIPRRSSEMEAFMKSFKSADRKKEKQISNRMSSQRTLHGHLCRAPPSGSPTKSYTLRQTLLPAKNLAFLDEYMKAQTSLSNINEYDECMELSDEQPSLNETQVEQAASTNLDVATSQTTSKTIGHGPCPLDQPSSPSTDTPEQEKKTAGCMGEEANPRIQDALNSLEKENDQDSLFGQYIAGELRQITDPRVKLILKMAINNKIAKARLALLQTADNES
ncbi:uncharacterized protein [Diadema setosum]|uniref:uncharacterized protein isoform X2 n=1 Tax=Diadema setosum TaxID=31175 RepID=UPI003B3B111E